MASSDTKLLEWISPAARDLVRGSPLENDQDRLLELLELDAADQVQVARLHLNLTMPWDQAIGSFPPAAGSRGDTSGGDGEALPAAKHRPDGSGPFTRAALLPETQTLVGERNTRQIIRIRVTELRPNPINATIYLESLTDEKLRDLADHMARHGQQDPILADATLQILEGERRWRALQLIGAEYADVIIDSKERSPEEVEDLVLDAFSLKRKPSMNEQLQLYQTAVRSYARRYGRALGRPRKPDKILSGFWDSNRIKDEAAAAAGLGSRETARMALRVMEQADQVVKGAMLSGTMSISAAYVSLRPEAESEIDLNVAEGNTEQLDAQREKQLGSSPPHQLGGGAIDQLTVPATGDNSASTPSSQVKARQPGATKTRPRKSNGRDVPPTTVDTNVVDKPVKALRVALNDEVEGKVGVPSEPASDSSGRSNGIIQGEQQTNETRRGATPVEQEADQDRTGDEHRDEHDVGESPADAPGQVGSSGRRLKPKALGLGRQLSSVISKMADDDFDEAAAVLDEIFANLTEALGERQHDEPEDDESAGEREAELPELAELLDGI